jgi:hypothetical protein
LGRFACSQTRAWLALRELRGHSSPETTAAYARNAPPCSLGDDQCRFEVLETDDPFAGYTDKVEQRFADQQKSG